MSQADSSMAGESGAKYSSSSAGDSYIGSFMSLISKYEIRYEGILYFLNIQDSTIGLKNVRSYGTEGRRKDGPQIPPSDKVYEYILFQGSDIKDLQVKSSPPAQTDDQVLNDPAVIQSRDARAPLKSPSSASLGQGIVTGPTYFRDTSALTRKGYPGVMPSYQPVAEDGTLSRSLVPQIVGSPSLSMPSHMLGNNRTEFHNSVSPQHPMPFQSPSAMSFPREMQNRMQVSPLQPPTNIDLENKLKSVSPSSSTASVHQNLSPSLIPEQYSTPLDISSNSAIKTSTSIPSHYISAANRSTLLHLPLLFQDLDSSKAQLVGKGSSDPIGVLAGHSVPHPTSSFVGSTMGPLLAPPSSLVSTNPLSQSGSHVLPISPNMYPDSKVIGSLTQFSSNSSLLIPTPVHQPPLFPLPTSAQKSPLQFTEEFDFTAMNKKFKKDEVWGYLGKANQGGKQGVDGSATGQLSGEKESPMAHTAIANSKPAYNKDEFFDTISCSSLSRGARNEQNQFSERMKFNSETYGNFQQKHNLGFSGYGVGHGDSFRGTHFRGRGYGNSGRGHGANMPF